MITPAVKTFLNRSYHDHKISSTRSESHISISEPLIIPKRSLSSATLYTNDEQVSEVTSTIELNKEYPTCTQSLTRLQIQNINYSPLVLLHCIDGLIKRRRRRRKEVDSMKCGHCPKTFTDYDKLERHLKIHDKPNQRFYSCEEPNCNEIFHCKYKLKSHERAHCRLFHCKTCNEKMNLGLSEFQWHESICRGQKVDDSNARLTRSKSIHIRNEESVERMYEARMELWHRPDASECDIDPEEQKLVEYNQKNRRKLDKDRRYSRSASVYAEEHSGFMEDPEYMDEIDFLDSQSNYYGSKSVASKSTKLSKASKSTKTSKASKSTKTSKASKSTKTSKASRASTYSQTSTKSKPIAISIRSNYSHISRNEYSHMNDESLVKVRENYVKHRKRTRSISLSLAKVELELVCRSQRKHPRDASETGVEINNQIKKRMIRLSKNVRDFTCQEVNCERSFGSLNELMKHEQEAHNYLPMFRCVICKACFTKKIYLMNHRDKHHQQIVNCPLCLDVCASMEERKIHIDLHLVQTHICAFCDMGFVQETLLAKHELDVHGIFSMEVKMDVLARKILKQRPQNIEIISRHFYTKKETKNITKKTLKFPAAGYNIIRKQYTRRQYYPNYAKFAIQPSQLFDAKLHDEKNDDSRDSFLDATKDAPNYLVNYDKFESDRGLISPETVTSHEGDKYDDFEVPKPADDNDSKVNFQPDDLFNYLMLTQFTSTG